MFDVDRNERWQFEVPAITKVQSRGQIPVAVLVTSGPAGDSQEYQPRRYLHTAKSTGRPFCIKVQPLLMFLLEDGGDRRHKHHRSGRPGLVRDVLRRDRLHDEFRHFVRFDRQ